jgi:hypothetical protein
VDLQITIGVLLASVFAFFIWANSRTRKQHAHFAHSDVEDALEELLSNDSHDNWDLFLAWPIDDPYLESLRQRCLRVVEECPREKPNEDISQAGTEQVRAMLKELRQKYPTDPSEKSS